jgi:hypothetical protein
MKMLITTISEFNDASLTEFAKDLEAKADLKAEDFIANIKSGLSCQVDYPNNTITMYEMITGDA